MAASELQLTRYHSLPLGSGRLVAGGGEGLGVVGGQEDGRYRQGWGGAAGVYGAVSIFGEEADLKLSL